MKDQKLTGHEQKDKGRRFPSMRIAGDEEEAAPGIPAEILAPLRALLTEEARRLQQARVESGQAEQEAAGLRREVEALRQEREGVAEAIANLKAHAVASLDEASRAETTRKAAAAELDRSRRELEETRQSVAEARIELARLAQESATRQAELISLAEEREQSLKDLAASLAIHETHQGLLQQLKEQVERAGRALGAVQAERATTEQAIQEALATVEQINQRRAAAEVGEAEANSQTQAARQSMVAMEQRRAELELEVALLMERLELLRTLPDPKASPSPIPLDYVPERLRDRATDSLFVRVPALDKAALEQASQGGRRAQDLVRDALRATLGADAYVAAIKAFGVNQPAGTEGLD